MAPHPMYSIGYFGYYGISLLCASYTVLFVSIAAHALQFAFLILVETPRKQINVYKKNECFIYLSLSDIDKTYNPPPTIKRRSSTVPDQQTNETYYADYFRRNLVTFKKSFDLFRATDLVTVFVLIYAVVLPLLVPSRAGITIAVIQAFIWRALHSLGNGVLLRAQSSNKLFTRHFIKWGGNTQEAFVNWKR